MIELRELSGGYQQNTVFSGVSFRVEPGSVCVLLGGNGSGKSTLIKTIAGLLPRKNGEIYIGGKETAGLSAIEKARLLACMMQRNTSPNITVESLVLHGRYPHLRFPRKLGEKDYGIACESLDMMGILHLKNKALPNISGGELQKAYVAMALAQDAPVMLLDEPNAYLDIRHQRELFKIIVQLKQKGKTIITALHDIPSALEIADTLCVLNHGEQIYFGTPAKLANTDILNRVFNVDIQFITQNGRRFYSIQ